MFIRAIVTSVFLLLSTAPTSWAAGLLTPKQSHLPKLELSDHAVSVIIEDGYAITRIEQIFVNPHGQDLEALYAFPIPDKAAVAQFSYWIDNQQIIGEVVEKQTARQIYEQEKNAGRETGLTEQDGYKTFEMRIFPVKAHAQVRIQLVYFQPLAIDTGIGRFVYPLEDGGVDEAKLAFWDIASTVTQHFSFDLTLKSSYPVTAMRLPNQPNAVITQTAPGVWHAHMESGAATQSSTAEAQAFPEQAQTTPAAQYNLDKDIVLYWRHQPGLPGAVDLIAHRVDATGTGSFMLLLTPGDDLKPITQGKDWTLVLDRSGSMSGKYATLTNGVARGLERMQSSDRFRIILFNNSTTDLTGGFVPATPENKQRMIEALRNSSTSGGTNLYAGLSDGVRDLDADRTHAVLLVTDGVANVGETEQKKFLSLLEKTDVRLFTFIMGNSANKPLLEMLTRESNGFAQQVSNNDDLLGQLMLALSKVTHEAMHGLRLDIDGVQVSDLTPVNLGSLYRGQQLVVFGRYTGGGPAKITLSGKISGQEKTYSSTFDFPAAAQDNPEIERLWAFAKIQDLSEQIADFGEKSEFKSAIIDLATQYGLVTNYTSMIVLRDERFQHYGIKRHNQQRSQIEQQAQQQRSHRQAPVSHRVDNQQPLFNTPQPRLSRPSNRRQSGGSSGAIGPWDLLLLIPLMAFVRRKKHA